MSHISKMASASGKGLELNTFKDLTIFNNDYTDPETMLKNAHAFQYKDGDIILCTYPSSGTHWIGSMMWTLKSKDPSKRMKDTILEIEAPGAYDIQEYPRLMWSHMNPDHLPSAHLKNNGKIVLMLRNPKDVAVSYFYHLRDSIVTKNGQTWDEYFQSFIQGEISLGSYFVYLKKWEQILKEVAEGNTSRRVEVFYYEDFQLKPKENLERLNKFLEFNRDDDYLNDVLTKASFPKLKKSYDVVYKDLPHAFDRDSSGNLTIFRKGKVGDWKNHFTVAQSETVDQLLQESLQHGIIKFKYEI